MTVITGGSKQGVIRDRLKVWFALLSGMLQADRSHTVLILVDENERIHGVYTYHTIKQ